MISRYANDPGAGVEPAPTWKAKHSPIELSRNISGQKLLVTINKKIRGLELNQRLLGVQPRVLPLNYPGVYDM